MITFDLPPPPPPPIEINHACLISAAYYYQLPPEVLLAIRMQEGGSPGLVRTNTNGSRDLGVMQINTIHLERFAKHGISEDLLKRDECVSIFAGAHILQTEVKAAGDFWQGVGRYHSRTPSLRDGYIAKVRGRLEKLQRRHQAYFIWLKTVVLPKILGV